LKIIDVLRLESLLEMYIKYPWKQFWQWNRRHWNDRKKERFDNSTGPDPWAIHAGTLFRGPLFFKGQHGGCYKAPESENMKAGRYARKVWGNL
jgi:hypothetical protein